MKMHLGMLRRETDKGEAKMRTEQNSQYRRALLQVLETCDCRPRPTAALAPQPDWNDKAAECHERYITDRNEEMRWGACEAARRALERLGRRTFGYCIDCRERIPAKRLAAMPWAERCLKCQLRRESLRELPRAA